jgi:L,D-transpeptidase YcbB
MVYGIARRVEALLPSSWRRLGMGLVAGLLATSVVVVPRYVAAAEAIADAVRARVTALRAGRDVHVDGEQIASRKLIPEFYAQRGYLPAWTRADQVAALLAVVEASRSHGLDPADYHVGALRRHAAAPGEGSPAAVADRDLLCTDALVRLAYHLHFGKANPRELYPDWSFTRSLGTIDPVQALDALVRADRLAVAIKRYAPQLPQYRRLRDALGRYRAIEASGGWPQLADGPKLERGAEGSRVETLRKRLAATGDLDASDARAGVPFDEVLDVAVRRFQTRQGLEVDGVVGARTREALNVGIGQRIDQIRANLERLRWVAQDLAGDYLLVDIAGFTARLYLGDRLAWSSRAVVGQPYRKTPVFRATMEDVVLNPTWTVPPTILREDVLPKVALDPGYLAQHDMQVVDAGGRPVDAAAINWRRYRQEGFPYQIVQASGGANPLGRVKFLLPNPYSVYLHDTPSVRLFDRSERAFSSGCIRLQAPLALAVLLLDDSARWGAQGIEAAIATGKTHILPVRRHVPVLLLYFTAEVSADGTVHFRRDVYARDPRVLAALRAPFRFSPVDQRR